MDCHQPAKLSLCFFSSDILKKKEKGKTRADISQLFLTQHLNLPPMSREHPTWNPECRQSLNPALEPDGTTCLLCQPPPLFGCRLVVHVSLIRFTPSLGFEARRQRANSGDAGAGAVEAMSRSWGQQSNGTAVVPSVCCGWW